MTGVLPLFPRWVVIGVLIGLAIAAVFAIVFVVGTRLYPNTDTGRGTGTRTDGHDRKRTEVRQYLGAIGEPYEENAHVAGERVAFHLADRNVAISFDALTYFRLTDAGIQAVLVEHEMPITNLGSRLPFETPRFGWNGPTGIDPDDAHSRRTALAALGLEPDATLEEVTTAYRAQVKDAHPDHGGDPETFNRVREAYRIARRSIESEDKGASTTS